MQRGKWRRTGGHRRGQSTGERASGASLAWVVFGCWRGRGGRFAARMLPLWDTQKSKRTPVVTGLLILANLGVFGYELMLAAQGGKGAEAFLTSHALVPSRLIAGWADEEQWLTLLTHMFLHGGVAHVLGNCWFLWVFGNNVEDRLGSFLYLLFYAAAGLGAAAMQVLVDPSSSLPMLGASGAISGVLGAYFVLFPTAWVVTLVPWIVPIVPVPAFVFLDRKSVV